MLHDMPLRCRRFGNLALWSGIFLLNVPTLAADLPAGAGERAGGSEREREREREEAREGEREREEARERERERDGQTEQDRTPTGTGWDRTGQDRTRIG